MRKFKYRQINYIVYPSAEELNEVGELGWELLCIELLEERTSVLKELKTLLPFEKVYKATFKKEIVDE